MAFPRRFAVFLLIMVALVATAGCGAGNLGDGGNQAQPPAAAEAPREPDQIALPEDGGKWPWPIVAAGPAAPEQAFDLTEHIPPKRRFWSAAVNPRAGRAAVMITDEQASATPHRTTMLWCDLATGQLIRQLEMRELTAPFDIHPGGQRILIGGMNQTGMGKDTLELLTLLPDGSTERKTWQPFYHPGQAKNPHSIDKEPQVQWAGFVGPRHIVTVCGNGKLYIWETDTLKRVGSISGVTGFPAVTNDGNMLAFVSGHRAALVDPSSGKVLGARRIGEPSPNSVLAFDPEGERLACASAGRVAVLDLRTGDVASAPTVELDPKPIRQLLPTFGWAGSKHFFNHENLFDLDNPTPVWHYYRIEWAVPRGRQVWAVIHTPEKKGLALRPYALPQPGVQDKIAASLKRFNVFALRPGDPVQIDVAGIAPEKQAEVARTLERRALQFGYQPAPNAPVVFQASEDRQGTTERVIYSYSFFITSEKEGRKFTYTKRPARFKIVKGSKVLWETSGYVEPPYRLEIKEGMPTHLSICGGPRYEIFAESAIPGVIRNDNEMKTLGQSELTPGGIRERR